MLKAFPDATLYTSLYEPDSTYPEFADYEIRTLWTNRLRALRSDHRRGLALYPFAFSGLRIDDADLVLCSSSGFSHGVRTDARKVVYCYSPARWLYDQAETYLAGWPAPVRVASRAVRGPLRAWDRRAAASADTYLTSSTVVRDRIRATYGIDAEVLAPAVSRPHGAAVRIPGLGRPFVLCASRLLNYKNVDTVVAALELLPDARLVVVGDGPERCHLEAMAGANVRILGRVTDSELTWLYAHCVGLVSASIEDFGLTPLEAALFGKPSAVLRSGGFLDTVVENRTGVFFDGLTPTAVGAGIASLLAKKWDSDVIAAHSARYGEDRFVAGLRSVGFGEVPAAA